MQNDQKCCEDKEMDSLVGTQGIAVCILDCGNYPAPDPDAIDNGLCGCPCGDGNEEVLKSSAAVADRKFHGYCDFRKLGGAFVLGGRQNQDSP